MNEERVSGEDELITPTEYLMMEVLAARHRLGEHCWTFPSSVTQTARRLETHRYVGWKSGNVERTIRVWLTDHGIKTWKLDRPYPPNSDSNSVNDSETHMVVLPWRANSVPVISLSAQEMVQAIIYFSTRQEHPMEFPDTSRQLPAHLLAVFEKMCADRGADAVYSITRRPDGATATAIELPHADIAIFLSLLVPFPAGAETQPVPGPIGNAAAIVDRANRSGLAINGAITRIVWKADPDTSDGSSDDLHLRIRFSPDLLANIWYTANESTVELTHRSGSLIMGTVRTDTLEEAVAVAWALASSQPTDVPCE